MINNKTGLIEY